MVNRNKKRKFFGDNPKLINLTSVTIFLILWEILGRISNPVLFSPPSKIIMAYPKLVISGELFSAFVITITAMLSGFIFASVLGIVIGLIWGRSSLLQDIMDPYINALYAIPRVALIPLVIVWFGIGFWGRFFIIAWGSLFDVMINTYTGVRYTDKTLLEVGKSFGANQKQTFRHIIIPYSIPFIISGLRLGIGRALVGVIVAEMFLQMTGLGGLILTYSAKYQIDVMLSVVIILSLMGVFLTWVVKKIEIKIAPWRVQ